MSGCRTALWLSCMLLAFVAPADADGPSAARLLRTLELDPDSPVVPDVLERLSQDGPKGWRLLAQLARECEGGDRDLDGQAAAALLDGPEGKRFQLAGELYDQVHDPNLKARLALGLARVYPDGGERLHDHLRANREGSLDLLRVLGTRGLPREVLTALLEHAPLADLASELLAGRRILPRVVGLLGRAREVARRGLDPETTRAFVEELGGAPSRDLLEALCEVLRDEDPETRLGAHCALLTASGRTIAPDADLWRGWLAGQEAGYVVPDALSEGAISAAVRRGAHFLLQDLEPDGASRHAYRYAGDSVTGATALAALALRHAGVPADDPVLRRAVESTLLLRDGAGRPGLRPFPRRFETYTLALLAMALHAVGDEDRNQMLPALRDRLTQGVLANGQWTYTCRASTEGTRPAAGDNSNTQYANLGLRALRSSGVSIDEAIWQQVDGFWRTHQQPGGEWGYRVSGADTRRSVLQMTASGIAGLAIAREGLEGRHASASIAQDAAVQRGLQALGRALFLADRRNITPYSWYAVERACVLTGTRSFRAVGRECDWYREGVACFLDSQQQGGAWGVTSVRDWQRQGFGQAPSTAFALLFLTRATATIGDGQGAGAVQVGLTEEDVARLTSEGAPPAPTQPVVVPWLTPTLAPTLAVHLASPSLSTADGKVTVRGLVEGPWTRVDVGGTEVAPDEEGWFEVALEVRATGDVEVVAAGAGGSIARGRVHVVLDRTPPTIRLVGSPLRPAAPQRLELEADEALDGVEVKGYYFPAHGTHVHVTAAIDEGTSHLPVTAYDRAGNRTRERIPLQVTNRVLSLDGRSSIRVALRSKPEAFTAECWMRCVEANREQGVLGDTEGAGFGLFVLPRDGPDVWAYLHTGDDYVKIRRDRELRANRWTHVAMTYDGARVCLFVDGRLRDEAEAPSYKRCSKSLYLGATPNSRNGQTNPLVGAIDEFRLSDVVRYTKSFTPDYAHLPDRHTLVLYHFDTDTDAAVLDASGNENNGTSVGEPQIVAEKR